MQAGTSVVLDRYFYSTLAYHMHIVPDEVRTARSICEHLIKPDAVLLIETSYDVIQRRIQARETLANDRLFMSLEQYRQIQDNYRQLLGDKCIVITNDGELEATKKSIITALGLCKATPASFMSNRPAPTSPKHPQAGCDPYPRL